MLVLVFKCFDYSILQKDISAQHCTAHFRFSQVTVGARYCLFAHSYHAANGKQQQDALERVCQFPRGAAVGWFTNEVAGWMKVVVVAGTGNVAVPFGSCDFEIRAARSAGLVERLRGGAGAQLEASNSHGRLKLLPCVAESANQQQQQSLSKRSIALLQLSGSASERGFAHGMLLASEILDFFEFYLIESRLQSARQYSERFLPFVATRIRLDSVPELHDELRAVMDGMRSSGVDLYVPFLRRLFEFNDLLALNALFETRASLPVESPARVPPASSCTQFALHSTTDSGDSRTTLAARNMDGELDVRKVTCSHFVMFAHARHEPSNAAAHVSCMWPGFVGTLSAVNEHGLYVAENAGQTRAGPVVGGVVPISLSTRQFVSSMDRERMPTSVDALHSWWQRHRSDGGGVNCTGGLLLFVLPTTADGAPTLVIQESDRFETHYRTLGEHRPSVALMSSNHFLSYGAGLSVNAHPTVFGVEIGQNSVDRYNNGQKLVEQWQQRSSSPIAIPQITVNHMKQLLQVACHDTTEHCYVYRIDQSTAAVELFVSNAEDSSSSVSISKWRAPFETQWVRCTVNDKELYL
jgi:hypothetical protein